MFYRLFSPSRIILATWTSKPPSPLPHGGDVNIDDNQKLSSVGARYSVYQTLRQLCNKLFDVQFIATFHPVDDFFDFLITWACTWAKHGAISPKRRNLGTLNCWKSRLTMKINIQKKRTNINKLIWWEVWYTENLASIERSFWLSSMLRSPPWGNDDDDFDVQVVRIMRGG